MRKLILNRLKLKKIGIISIPIFLFPMQQLLVSASGFYPSKIVAYVEKSSLFSDVFRSVIWSIVYFFSTICTFFENGMWKILGFTNNFFQIDGLVKLMNKTDKVYLVFLVPVVAFVGYQILIREKLDPLKQFCRNFLFLMIVTLSISTLLNIGNSVLMGAVGSINQQSKISVGEQVILDNLYDIEYLKKNPNSSVKNYYALKGNVNLEYFDLTTKADRDVFKTYPIYDESTSSWKELDLSDGMILTGFGKEYVYRYTLDNPFIIIIQLVTLTFGFVFSSLKFAVLILELGFKRVILLGVGILDLSSGTKFKRLLVEIGNTLILMFIVVILVQCYVIANSWITKVSSDDIYVELILRMASVLMLLNGPRIVETLFGLDAGISKDGLQAVHYATSLGRTASSIGQSIGRTGSKAKSLATGFGKRMKETTNKVLDTRGTESSTSAQHQVANRLDRPNEVLKGHEKAKEQGIKNQRSERLDKVNQSLQGSITVGEQGTTNEVAERLDKPNQSFQGSMTVGEQGTANEVAERLDKPNQSLQGSMMVGEQGMANKVAERLDKPNQSFQGSMTVGEQGTANEVAGRLDKPNQSFQGSMTVGEQGTANEVAKRLDKPNQLFQGSMMVGEQGTANEVAKRLDKSNQTLQSHIQDGASNLQNQKVKQMDSSEQPQTGHLGYKPSIREMAQQSHIGRQIAKTNSQAQQWIGDKKQVVINKGLDTVKSGINYADQIAMPLINKMSPILPPSIPKNGEIQPMPSSVLMKDRTPTTHPYSQPLGQQNLSSPKVVVPPPKITIGSPVERPIESQLNTRGFNRNSNVNRESQTLVSNRGALNKPPQK